MYYCLLQYKIYIIAFNSQYTICIIQYTVYNIHYTIYNTQFAIYNIQYAKYIISMGQVIRKALFGVGYL